MYNLFGPEQIRSMSCCVRVLSFLLAVASLHFAAGVAVMSVDLGSEWMKIAVVSPGVPMEIALNPQTKRKTSVAVSMKDGERKFGSDAMIVCVKSPKHCYYYLLDLLGKKIDHPAVVAYQKRFPQYTLEADPERGTVLFRHDSETVYSVEELLGMILAHAKTQAEAYTEQAVRDVVITTPVFFNQAERLALVAAAQLGGLNVLQLMNTPMAVALNYGMFRRKEINGTVKHMMLYDMGAQATTATIVGFQIVKTKERGYSETHPQAQILGVGYDRTLGGTEITFRVREYLADQFNEMKKTKTDVRSVPRAMGKLLKEAERVKLILSANTECYAQVENVMEDIDFKHHVTRDKLLELIEDLLPRVTKPVERALSTSGMSMENIDQVIIVGGGTRVPKFQELLQTFVGKELGKNLNADESAALGSVYKSADISSGFKVKKFITKDAVIFPIDVDFSREIEADEETSESSEASFKKIRRTLFSRINPFPQKKIMTFNKHVKDFTFNVNYADLSYLGETEVAWIGSNNITSVVVKGVKEALENNLGENVETKGVKAHFALDDSGILSVNSIESVFEKTISVEEQEKKEKEWKEATEGIDWSKLGENIKSFFGTDEKKEGGETEEKSDDTTEDKSKEDGKEKLDTKEDAKKAKDDKTDKKADKDSKKEKEKPKEPKKPKIETVKVDLSSEDSRNDIELLTGDIFNSSKAKLEALTKADNDRIAIELALNELQGYSIDMMDKMEDEDFQAASTEEEREKLSVECGKVSEWLDEEAGMFVPVEEFQSKLKVLKELSAPILARLREHSERPEALEMLRQSLNSSRHFLEKSRDLVIPVKPKEVEEPDPEEKGEPDTPKEASEEEDKSEKKEEEKPEEKPKQKKKKKKDKIPDEGVFTEKELESLEKKIDEVEKWRDEKVSEQKQQPTSQMPKLTVSMIKSKIQDLDGEVQFMISKARMIKAERERAKRKAEEEKKKEEEEKAKKEKKEKKKKKKASTEETEEEKSSTKEESVEDVPVGTEEETTSDSSDKKPEDNADDNPDTTDLPDETDEEKPSDSQDSDPEHTEL